MKITAVFLLILLPLCANAQGSGVAIDSLTKQIERYEDYDTNKINALIGLGQLIAAGEGVENDFTELELYEEAYRQSKIGKHAMQLVKSAHLIGVEYFYLGKFDEAEQILNEALALARKNRLSLMVATVLADLGQIEDMLGKDKLSLTHTLEAIEILEDLDNAEVLVGTYNNLAGYYYYRELNEEALEYYMKAKELLISRLNLKDNFSVWAITESNIGWCYYYMGNLSGAIDQLKRGVEIHTKYDYYSPSSGNSRTNLASLYVESKNYELAKIHAKDGLDICLELNYVDGIGKAYHVLGEIEFSSGNYGASVQAYSKALEYADSLGDLYSQVQRSQLLAKSYDNLGNYKLAYIYSNQAKTLNDSLKQIESEAAFEDAITKYDTEKKEAENALLQKEAELKDVQIDQERIEAKAEKERNFLIGGSVGLILLLGLFFLINRNRLKTRINAQLAHQRDEIAEQKQEITDSITYAKRIQNSFLPAEKEFEHHFSESFLMYEPKDIVAGDFYILEEAGGYVFFAVADCTGHGVPGAMVSIVCSNAIRKVLHELNEYDPGKVLDKTREIVIAQFERKGHTVNDGMDISFCRYDKKNNKIAWAGAYNALLIIRAQNEVLHELKPNKQPIGAYITNAPFTTHEVEVESGDILYMSSDGYPDQFGGEKGKKYKYKRFKELLQKNSKESLQRQKSLISSEFWEWKQGFEQIDDVCVMGVKI